MTTNTRRATTPPSKAGPTMAAANPAAHTHRDKLDCCDCCEPQQTYIRILEAKLAKLGPRFGRSEDEWKALIAERDALKARVEELEAEQEDHLTVLDQYAGAMERCAKLHAARKKKEAPQ